MKNIISILLFSISFIKISAQVGVGTTSPYSQTVFHVDAAQNNATAAIDVRNLDDVVITPDGKLGIGNVNPITRVDLRNNANENVVGIGITDQSAGTAGAGAVKYHEQGTNWGLSYSNGSSWIFLPVVPVKSLVYAYKNSSQTINNGTITPVINWTESSDETNSFNPTDGTFRAPMDGVYIVSANLATQSGNISNNSYTETIIQSNATNGVPQFRCINSYPGYTTGNATNATGNNCTGIFYLQKDNTVNIRFLHNMSTSSSISTDGTLNTLTITQL